MMPQWMRNLYGKLLWKAEESKRLTTIVFFLITIAGIYIPHISKELNDMGINLSGWVLFPLIVVAGFIGVLILGHIIDKLKMWEDDWKARLKRNPYETYLLRPKERIILRNQAEIFENLGKRNWKRYNKAVNQLKDWVRTGEVT